MRPFQVSLSWNPPHYTMEPVHTLQGVFKGTVRICSDATERSALPPAAAAGRTCPASSRTSLLSGVEETTDLWLLHGLLLHPQLQPPTSYYPMMFNPSAPGVSGGVGVLFRRLHQLWVEEERGDTSLATSVLMYEPVAVIKPSCGG